MGIEAPTRQTKMGCITSSHLPSVNVLLIVDTSHALTAPSICPVNRNSVVQHKEVKEKITGNKPSVVPLSTSQNLKV
jgi:hypothetical protein